MTPLDSSDEFRELLMPAGGGPPASQALRDAVLAQTTRTVRVRRRLRRAGTATLLLACYAGGIATMRFWPAGAAESHHANVELAGVDQQDEPAALTDSRPLVRPEDDQNIDVRAARLSPYERLRRTGDRQLQERDDMVAAARSYTKALQLASADQRSLDPDRDTWLLMALKQSIN
jgi:hypothetical protein